MGKTTEQIHQCSINECPVNLSNSASSHIIPVGLTTGNWIQMIIWAIPMIFMAATMWVSVGNLKLDAEQYGDRIHDLDLRTNELSAKARVSEEKSISLGGKVDSLGRKVDRLDEKMSDAGNDLSAIKEKLNIKKE